MKVTIQHSDERFSFAVPESGTAPAYRSCTILAGYWRGESLAIWDGHTVRWFAHIRHTGPGWVPCEELQEDEIEEARFHPFSAWMPTLGKTPVPDGITAFAFRATGLMGGRHRTWGTATR